MWDLIKVAVRNVGRNKRRTLITVLTVFLGVVVSTATRGLLNGLQGEIRSNLTRKLHGDLQVHERGYQDSLESNPYKLLIPEPATSITVPGEGALDTAPRLRLLGLLNHQKSQTTTPVVITAIDSTREAAVCPRLAEAVQKGAMLDSRKERLAPRAGEEELGEATGLDAAASDGDAAGGGKSGVRAEGFHQIMVTPSLQRGLGAEVGDEVVVLLADKDNMQQAIVARIVAVVDVATPGAAARMAWMDLRTLQTVLAVPGLASEVALRVPDESRIDEVRAALSQTIPGDQVIETWLELSGILRDAMALQDVIFSAVVAIMFAIVIAAIVNTSLMTVMERTREIGTLMALGYRRRHILLLFLTEAAVIGGAGGALGLAVGGALISVMHFRGLEMKLPGQVVVTTLYPSITVAFLVLVLALSTIAALLSGLAPAYRASRLKPVEALSSN
jgi:putative ABC transport system permease protein